MKKIIIALQLVIIMIIMNGKIILANDYTGITQLGGTDWDRTDGTKIEQSDSSSGGFRYRTVSPATDICIEFDFKVVNASDSICSFRNISTIVKSIYANHVSAEANTWTHIKVTVKDGKYYLNNSASGTALSTWNRFNFQSYGGNSLKYKNFEIYPI